MVAPLFSPLHQPFHRSPQGWSLLSIFVTTVMGLVLAPLPVGAWAFLCITATVCTDTLTFEQVGGNGLAGSSWEEAAWICDLPSSSVLCAGVPSDEQPSDLARRLLLFLCEGKARVACQERMLLPIC